MVYVPVDVPLANVSNAWMFLESPQDLDKFSKAAGLFRPQEKSDQLFQLYESEAYACQHYYTQTIPTRPYLVTTDIFWENFAAAYEGLFVLLERRQAIPIFWAFVQEADAVLAWPLLDARLLPGSYGVLCALHRRDSFLMLSPESKGTRVAAYRWNGFGFGGMRDEEAVSACRALFGEENLLAH